MSLVVALDDSNGASTVIDEATKLARDLDIELHVIHVFDRSELVEIVDKDVEGQNLTENMEVRALVEDIVDRATDGDVDARIEIRVGDPAEQIVAYAADVGARYVVVGGRTRSPTGKVLFGSVTQRVLFRSPVPVLNVALDDR